MPGEEPFRERWPEPADDLRDRFGRLLPSFSSRELATLLGRFLVVMVAVVVALEFLI